jgi:SAM-dependent methyltransferase
MKLNDTHQVYSSKAEAYARYRWDYAPAALDWLWQIIQLNGAGAAADVGAGSGILTRHLASRFRRVCALEPNAEMRALAARDLPPGCLTVGAAAEALPLPDACLNLLAAGQAVHWFQPAAARAEFRRVLKPEGWIVFISNHGADPDLGAALAALNTPENGYQGGQKTPPGLGVPPDYYLADARAAAFPFSLEQDWESFLGSLVSASFLPSPGQPGFDNLERAARAVFARFSRAGTLTVRGMTDLVVGHARR